MHRSLGYVHMHIHVFVLTLEGLRSAMIMILMILIHILGPSTSVPSVSDTYLPSAGKPQQQPSSQVVKKKPRPPSQPCLSRALSAQKSSKLQTCLPALQRTYAAQVKRSNPKINKSRMQKCLGRIVLPTIKPSTFGANSAGSRSSTPPPSEGNCISIAKKAVLLPKIQNESAQRQD